MERLPSVRASDSDREQAAERLRHATAEGRLTAAELEERLERLFAARTYGELDPLLADLPANQSRAPRVHVARWAAAAGAIALMLPVLGMLAVVGHRHSEVAAFGDGHFGRSPFPDRFGYSHHALALAPSLAGVVAFLLAGAAVLWMLTQSRGASDA